MVGTAPPARVIVIGKEQNRLYLDAREDAHLEEDKRDLVEMIEKDCRTGAAWLTVSSSAGSTSPSRPPAHMRAPHAP